jgi:IS5 family transposase
MIRIHSQKQMTLEGFETPFERAMDKNNRWVKLGECIPWDALAEAYYQSFTTKMGRPAKDARLVIGAVIIKHKLKLSDEETVRLIQENPYLQYFCGLPGFQTEPPFAPSLFVEIRRRMGAAVFEQFHQAIIDQMAGRSGPEDDQEPPSSADRSVADIEPETEPDQAGDSASDTPEKTHQGRLILDATVAEQAIRFPTDLGLLNESREISERLIDALYPHTDLAGKPRTYRQKARKAYLDVVKQRRPGGKKLRRGIKHQLQYLRRNLGAIETLLDSLPGRAMPLAPQQLKQYWVIQHVYAQQAEMYHNKRRRCDDRIVSLHQPHVRPIIRGKANKTVEFGAKLSVSLTGNGLARVDHIRWDAFHEGADLKHQVEAYKARHGVYPESVHADPVYGTRENRAFLQAKGIRYAGKPLGRPRTVTEQNAAQLKREKQQRQADYRQRIPIEGKFGQGKNGYSLSYIRAKTARTSEAWIHSIFLVMNLLVLVRHFLVPEIILGVVAEWAGLLCRIRKNSRSPGLRILNCRMR